MDCNYCEMPLKVTVHLDFSSYMDGNFCDEIYGPFLFVLLKTVTFSVGHCYKLSTGKNILFIE